MDIVLNLTDHYLLTPYVYGPDWPENEPIRQLLSLLVISNIGGYLLYFLVATFSFYTIFDKRLLKHPQILQVGHVCVCVCVNFAVHVALCIHLCIMCMFVCVCVCV